MRKSLKINFVMNFILTASSIVFPLITFPYVSRILGPNGTGSVAMATSFVSYFTMIAMLGVPTYGIRACAKVRGNRDELSRVVQELLIINLVMSFIAYLCLVFVVFLVPKFREEDVLYLICSAAILFNVIGVNWLYQGLEQYSYITFVSLLFKLLGLVLMFLFVRSSNDYSIYGAITVIGGYGSGILNFIKLKKIIKLHPVGNYNFKRHIKPIFTFFAMSVATTVYTNLDVVMLGVMKTSVDVGYYNAAVKMKTLLVTLVTSLGTVLLPRLSYYYSNQLIDQFRVLVSKAFSFVFIFAVPCCVFVMACAKEIILFLAGAGFEGAVIPMIIITPTILFIGLSNITGIQVLVPTGREKLVLYSVIVGAIVDIIINAFLIPFFGASGAAFGTLIAELLVLIVQIYYLRDLIFEVLQKVEFKQAIFSLIPSTMILLFVNSLYIESLFLSLLIKGIIFFFIYGCCLIWTKESILMDIISKMMIKLKGLK